MRTLNLKKLFDDTDNTEENFTSYVQGFLLNVQNMMERFGFDRHIAKIANSRHIILYIVLKECVISQGDSHLNKVAVKKNCSKGSRYILQSLSRAAQALWGKKLSKDGSFLWLPLVAHMTDSASSAEKLWNSWLSAGVKQAITAGIKGEDCGKQLFVFLAAAHDLGKATPVFQARQARPSCRELDEQIEEKLTMAGLPMKPEQDFVWANKTPHALATQILLENADCSRNVAAILGAHHGKPPSNPTLNSCGIGTYGLNYHLGKTGKEAWTAVQREIICFVLQLAGFRSLSDIPVPNMAAQVLLSGLLIMTDWIASNEGYFPYIRPDDALADFDKKTRAKTAWKKLALPCPWEANNGWMQSDLYQERFLYKPKSLQTVVAKTAGEICDPGILVLEAPMGAGKTEAALVCAEIFAYKTKRTGVFFALPTQATADGIFPRLLDWINKLDINGKYALKLAHGKAQFNEEYQALKLFEGSTNIGCDENGNVIVHEWFEGQKKSMLADFVVGTIDQLLLAGLKQKHVMLRHLGLAGKVVIIDECHAYDAYMGQYLNRVLGWLGAYRLPVIVLSATLPAQKRQAVIDAYLNKDSAPAIRRDPLGRNVCAPTQPPDWIETRDYPLITYTDNGKVKQKVVPSDGFSRDVHLSFLSEQELVAKLDDLLSSGGCAGVVVNTVKRAQEFAQILRERFGKETVRLLHSRFLAPDRAEKERELTEELGAKNKKRQRPARRIVVGTQVLEQSLDIDFDILISDLCPMDLLLQRIGRLHRHTRRRPEKLIQPHCLVMGCDGDDFEVGTEKIYGAYLLMRTKALLPERLVLPRDIPMLVQNTYDDKWDPPAEPQGYLKAKIKQANLIADKEKRAKDFRIAPCWPDLTQSLVGWLDADVSSQHGEAAVRDTDESMEVLLIKEKESCGRLGFLSNGQEIPLHEMPSAELAKSIARQRIRLPHALCGPWIIDKTIAALERMNSGRFAELQQSPWLKGELFLVLDENHVANLCGYRLSYNQCDGLLYEKEAEADA